MADKRKLADDLVGKARSKREKGGASGRAQDEELGVRCPYIHAFLTPPVLDGEHPQKGALLTMWTEGPRFVVKLLDTLTEWAVYGDGPTLLKALDALEALLSAEEVPWRYAGRRRGKK